MNAKKILESFKKELGKGIVESEIRRGVHGKKMVESADVWMEIDLSMFQTAMEHLCRMHPHPHFSVISGSDIGGDIELVYHFTVNYGRKHEEIPINISVNLPKSNAAVESICDLIPGALISEREMHEMMGVTFNNIPDSKRMFLSEDFPRGVYPWRRDETGADKLARNLHESEVVKKPKW